MNILPSDLLLYRLLSDVSSCSWYCGPERVFEDETTLIQHQVKTRLQNRNEPTRISSCVPFLKILWLSCVSHALIYNGNYFPADACFTYSLAILY
jgi:hypothetical protein